MSALSVSRGQTGIRGFIAVCLATAQAAIKGTLAYTIEVVRWPLFPVLYFSTLLLTYRAAGRTTADGLSPEGFLLVGTFAMTLWGSAIWTGGYAIERERAEGTISSLFLTPASRSAVVLGHSLGSLLIYVAPTAVIVSILAILSGARFEVGDPLAALLAFLALIGGALALGYLLSGAFVLTRRANVFANFIQSPIYLLGGMVVPVDDLPRLLEWFSFVFPLSAGMDALRAALLAGASTADIAGDLARFAVMSAALLVIGNVLLRRVENVAKRGGKLDFE
jgi:ABC-2 type transport system permease protein